MTKNLTRKIQNYSLGFTLIEAIVYIAISSILLLVITHLGFSIFESKQNILAKEEVTENANFIFQKISQAIRSADGIALPIDTSSELSLVMDEADINPTRFYLDGNDIYVAQGLGSGLSLTSDGVAISELVFTRLTGSTGGDSVNIKATLYSLKEKINTSFQVTISTRQ